MESLTQIIPLLLFMDASLILLAAEPAAVLSVRGRPSRRTRPVLPPVLATRPRFARNPAERFIPCHRLSIVLP